MSFQSLRELQSFVRSLDAPEERREVVEAELLDHFFARIAEGASEAEALAAFGSQEALRIRFEPVERGFVLTRLDAVRDGARVGAAFFGASLCAAFVSGAYWSIWRQVWFAIDGGWHNRLAMEALDYAANFGSLTDGALQIGFAVAFLAWALRSRRWARGMRAEVGAPSLHFGVSSGLGLAAVLVFVPLLERIMGLVHLFTGFLGGELGIAIWTASSILLLLVGPIGARIAPRANA